jgi:hypothetical protein
MRSSDLSGIVAAAVQRLNGVPQERLGEVVPVRRVLGIARAARITPRGSAWHLGVLLIADDGRVFETGEIVRAREEVRRGFAAESQRQRAAFAAAARRGGFAEGETVHLGWHELDLGLLEGGVLEGGGAAGPLALRDGEAVVRWSHSGGFVPLESYLDERIELLRHPPQGAT